MMQPSIPMIVYMPIKAPQKSKTLPCFRDKWPYVVAHLEIEGFLMLQQARRAALLERETGLQRWAIKLDLEAARQAAAAKALHQQLQKVSL